MGAFEDLVNSTVFGPQPGQPQAPGQPQQPVGPFAAMERAGRGFADFALGRDPAVSQEGVPSFPLRMGLSAADTPEEREAYLTKHVGQGGWTTDRYGNYAITPPGMQALGLGQTDRPTIIDAPFTKKGIELGDIADLRGDLPAVVGGVAGAFAATGAGAPIGIAASAGGAALGKLLDEVGEAAMGDQMQSAGQVATDVAAEAALGGTGEAIYRGALAPLGRKLLAPHASRITPEAQAMWEGAQEMDIPLKPTSITRAPLLSTVERIATSVLREDPVLDSGRKAVAREVGKLTQKFGKGNVSPEALGELVTSDIRSSRRALSRKATKWFGRVDELAKGNPIVRTDRLKEAAADIMEDFPKGTDGQPLFTQGEGLKGIFAALNDVNAMPDSVTVTEMWRAEQMLRDLGDIYNLAPGRGAHYSSVFGNAISKSYDDAVEHGKGAAVNALKEARRKYGENIKGFTNATVRRIIRDPKLAGSMTPGQIADFAATGADPTKIARIKSVVSPETWEQVQRLTMEKVLDPLMQRTKDPLEDVIAGDKLLKQLDKYGERSLNKMFGADVTRNLYSLGNAARAVEYKPGNAGQLIAATIAASPLANIGRLMQMKLLGKYLASGTGARHFTTGLKARKTRAISSALSRISTDMSLMAESEIPAAPSPDLHPMQAP